MLWAIRHMPGVTESEWFHLVDARTAGPDQAISSIVGGPTTYHQPGCPRSRPVEE